MHKRIHVCSISVCMTARGYTIKKYVCDHRWHKCVSTSNQFLYMVMDRRTTQSIKTVPSLPLMLNATSFWIVTFGHWPHTMHFKVFTAMYTNQMYTAYTSNASTHTHTYTHTHTHTHRHTHTHTSKINIALHTTGHDSQINSKKKLPNHCRIKLDVTP